jgi:hypothetical protein
VQLGSSGPALAQESRPQQVWSGGSTRPSWRRGTTRFSHRPTGAVPSSGTLPRCCLSMAAWPHRSSTRSGCLDRSGGPVHPDVWHTRAHRHARNLSPTRRPPTRIRVHPRRRSEVVNSSTRPPSGIPFPPASRRMNRNGQRRLGRRHDHPDGAGPRHTSTVGAPQVHNGQILKGGWPAFPQASRLTMLRARRDSNPNLLIRSRLGARSLLSVDLASSVPVGPDGGRLRPAVYPLVRAVGSTAMMARPVTTPRACRNGGRKSAPLANVRAPSEHHVIHNYASGRWCRRRDQRASRLAWSARLWNSAHRRVLSGR